jgi:hypothetical protein
VGGVGRCLLLDEDGEALEVGRDVAVGGGVVATLEEVDASNAAASRWC